jgi:hypothetical protein
VNKAGPIVRPGLGPCWVWTGAVAVYGIFRDRTGRRRVAHRVAWELESAQPIPVGILVCHHCDNPRCVNPAHLFLGTNADNMRDCKSKGRIASGDRHGARLHPESLPRGDDHHSRRNPGTLRSGDEHWSHRMPERVLRGDRCGSHLHPESRPRGESVAGAKLTAALVSELRVRSGKGERMADLAREAGVSFWAASRAIRGVTWRHVPLADSV